MSKLILNPIFYLMRYGLAALASPRLHTQRDLHHWRHCNDAPVDSASKNPQVNHEPVDIAEAVHLPVLTAMKHGRVVQKCQIQKWLNTQWNCSKDSVPPHGGTICISRTNHRPLCLYQNVVCLWIVFIFLLCYSSERIIGENQAISWKLRLDYYYIYFDGITWPVWCELQWPSLWTISHLV